MVSTWDRWHCSRTLMTNAAARLVTSSLNAPGPSCRHIQTVAEVLRSFTAVKVPVQQSKKISHYKYLLSPA